MKDKLILLVVKFGVALLWIMPFWLLYRLSSIAAFTLQYIIHYRYSIIKKNLLNSFPEKSEKEIKLIINNYYKNLADILLESIKGLSLSKKALCERYHFKNPDLLNAVFSEGKSAIVIGSHFVNWEWGVIGVPLWVKHPIIGIYKPMSNTHANNFLNRVRQRFGTQLTPMKQAGRSIIQHKSEPHIFVFIADQTPIDVKNAHWIDFLHQDTPFFHGVEKIARKTDYPIFYFDVRRVRRGFYDLTFIELCAEPKETKEGEFTAIYARQLERIINEYPQGWLWSHRRWKRKRKSKEERKTKEEREEKKDI